MIKSEKLNVYTIEQKKVALSNFDDKRYILDDGYTTLAHGHYRIRGDKRQNPFYPIVKRLEKFQSPNTLFSMEIPLYPKGKVI